jgi:glycosyltransferase involved in cell wall biosynthesis
MTDLAVIMSVYQNDRLTFLKKSVQSILDQTFTQFHYYIIFDGPVASEIDNYLSSIHDERIRLFRLDKNGGLAKALNYLLKIIIDDPQYKFIARMDADDVSMESRFEHQLLFFRSNPEVSCLGSWYKEIDGSDNVLSYQKLPLRHDEIIKFFMRRSPFAHPSVMFRRKMIEKAGFYPTDTLRLEDYVFWSNAIKAGLVFANLPEYLLHFRRDRDFYARRSGIKFGFKYIIIRFKINKVLKAPVNIYFYSVGIGMIRMLPAFIIRFIYNEFRKIKTK